MAELLEISRIQDRLSDLPDWTYRNGSLVRVLRVADFSTAVTAVARITGIAHRLGHHPDVDIGGGFLRFGVTSHDQGGVTDLDVDLAHRIEAAAGGFAVPDAAESACQ